jgi:hypothetical protein
MDNLQQIAQELEWANYARTAYFASVVPGPEVRISSEIILITDPSVPMTDSNHAALLRTTPERADALIERVIRHYREVGQKPCMVLSANCSPDDLPQRLLARGFVQYGGEEYWTMLQDRTFAESLQGPENIPVRQASAEDMPDFCQVMIAAFDMPQDTLPILHHAFGLINDLPGIHNYVAYLDVKPIGCASLFSYLGIGALGSMSVIPSARNSGAMWALAARSYQDVKQDNDKAMIFQTPLVWLDRLLQNVGCVRVLTRTYYIMND